MSLSQHSSARKSQQSNHGSLSAAEMQRQPSQNLVNNERSEVEEQAFVARSTKTMQSKLNAQEFAEASALGRPPIQMLDGLRSQFEQSSNEMDRRDDSQISLSAAVIYDDKRANFVFSDRSALVLHPNGDCFTLFAKSGQKTRQLVKFATNSAAKETGAGALSKLMLALQFFNSYGSEPILSREEQLDAEATVTKLYKYTHASWPGLDNLGDYLERSEDGNLTLRSTDEEDLASVTLSASGFQIRCSFLCLLPFKKPQWVEIGAGATQDMLQRSVMSSTLSEGARSQATARRMKMAYEYTRVTQVFTLSCVPRCWVYPVSLLLQAFSAHCLEPGCDLAVVPNFPDEETLAATQEQYYTELVPGLEYQTLLPQRGHETAMSDPELDGLMGAGSSLRESDLSQLSEGRVPSEAQKSGVWAQDDVSPASYMLNYKVANAVLWWTPFATTRLIGSMGEQAQVVLHQDGTVLDLRQKGQFITQYAKNSTDEGARVRSFTNETIPFKQVAHQDNDGEHINLQEILVDAFQLMRGFVFYQRNSVVPGGAGGGTEPAAAATIQQSMEQTKFAVQRMSGSTEVLREMQVQGLGSFTAYANYAIKVHFDDRTIVRMQKGQQVVKILSAKGDEYVFNIGSIARNQLAQRQFQNYIQVAMEFFDWVFLTKEE